MRIVNRSIIVAPKYGIAGTRRKPPCYAFVPKTETAASPEGRRPPVTVQPRGGMGLGHQFVDALGIDAGPRLERLGRFAGELDQLLGQLRALGDQAVERG